MRLRSFIILISLLSAASLFAQSNEISVLAGLSRLSKTDVEGSEVRFDVGTAYGVSYNRFWTTHFSTDVALLSTSNDASVRFGGQELFNAGSLDLRVLALTAQFHCIRHRALDVYAGAGAANVSASDLESADLALAGIDKVRVASRTTWLANAGAAIGLGHSFAVGVDGKYVRYRPSSASPGGDPVRLDVDPMIVTLVLKFRF
jgi:outer membrane protein W